MKTAWGIQNLSQAELLEKRDVELIIAVKELSKKGVKPYESFDSYLLTQLKNGKKISIEWDILQTEQDFTKTKVLVEKILAKHPDLIWRVLDKGGLEWLLSHPLRPQVFALLTSGHHNLASIKSVEKSGSPQLKRLILSPEIPLEVLESWLPHLELPVEVMGLGKIELFYSPRPLVKPLMHELAWQDYLEVYGESGESPHKGFPIVQNLHGTLMYHIKDLCLLEDLFLKNTQFLMKDKVSVRIDCREMTNISVWQKIIDFTLLPSKEKFEDLLQQYPHSLTKGFSRVNKTDVLFKKLKNQRIQKDDKSFLGEVIDTYKDRYLVIRTHQIPLKPGFHVEIKTPSGKEKHIVLKELRDINLHEIDETSKNQLVLIPYVSGVTSHSILTFDQGNNT